MSYNLIANLIAYLFDIMDKFVVKRPLHSTSSSAAASTQARKKAKQGMSKNPFV